MMHETKLPLVIKTKNGIHSSESYKSLVKQQRTDVKDCAKKAPTPESMEK